MIGILTFADCRCRCVGFLLVLDQEAVRIGSMLTIHEIKEAKKRIAAFWNEGATIRLPLSLPRLWQRLKFAMKGWPAMRAYKPLPNIDEKPLSINMIPGMEYDIYRFNKTFGLLAVSAIHVGFLLKVLEKLPADQIEKAVQEVNEQRKNND